MSCSDSDVSAEMEIDTQYLTTRAFIQNAQQIHNLSTSVSSMDEDNPSQQQILPPLLDLDPSDDVRRPLGAEAEAEAADFAEGESLPTLGNETLYNRKRINYETLELTDDEYLDNDTEDDCD